MARRESVSIALGKVLDQVRLSARPARGPQRRGRGAHREPDGAGVGRARVRDARAGAVARRLRRSPVAAVRRRQGAGHPRRARAADDAALGEGPRVSGRRHGRPRRGPLPALARRRKTKRSSKRSGGSATSASRARDRASCSRAPPAAACSATIRARSRRGSSTRFRPTSSSRSSPPTARPTRRRAAAGSTAPIRTAVAAARGERLGRGSAVREEAEPFDYAQEDQSVPGGLAPGRKVRHGQFGVGTVLSVEELDDDMKLVVQFVSVGHEDAAREIREAGAGRIGRCTASGVGL